MLTRQQHFKEARFDANHQYAFHPARSAQHPSSVSPLCSNCLQSQLAQMLCDCAGGKRGALVGGGGARAAVSGQRLSFLQLLLLSSGPVSALLHYSKGGAGGFVSALLGGLWICQASQGPGMFGSVFS